MIYWSSKEDNMKKRVLIFGVAAVQEDAIKVLQKMGHEVFAIAQKNDGPGAEAADHFVPLNFMDTEAVIDFIKENDIDAVYSTGSDLAMPQASAISEQLGMPHFVSEKTALICNKKDFLRDTLGQGFEGNVNYQVLETGEEELELPYPFIVKPSDSQGQRGITVVHNEEEFKEAFESALPYSRSKKVIAEQYIQGPEISVNGYMVDGQIRFIQASDRETWDDYFGLIHKHIVPAQVLSKESTEKLGRIMENACSVLEINNGPVYAQVKVENDEPYIIEITPRIDGCHMWNILERYRGFNLLKLTFEHLLYGDVSELDKLKDLPDSDKGITLEFICQEPGTKANYDDYQDELDKYPSYCYYKQGDEIRPVNGKYEKIGYFIYES